MKKTWAVVLVASVGFLFSQASSEAAEEFIVHYISPRTDGVTSTKCSTIPCQQLLHKINTSLRTIDFAIYGIRGQDEIIEALVAASNRGVAVRGVVDKTISGESYYTDTAELITLLSNVRDDQTVDIELARQEIAKEQKQEAELARKPFWERLKGSFWAWWRPRCSRPSGFDGPLQCLGYEIAENKCLMTAHASRDAFGEEGNIMHNKFFIIDGEWVWTGSANLSDTGTGGYNANIVAEIASPSIAKLYHAEFEQMFTQGRFHSLKKHNKADTNRFTLGGGTTLDVLFSPQDKPMKRVVKLIANAKNSINITIFFLTHKEVTRQLIKAHRRGVSIRVILDATAAKNGYTKHEILRRAGIPVKVENWGGKMHMKAASIDADTLILGSMNWTAAGAKTNDENTILIRGEHYVTEFNNNFESLWSSIGDEWLTSRPDPESNDSIGSCHDLTDNDFDGNVDERDSGCSDNPPSLLSLPPFDIVSKNGGNNVINGNINAEGTHIYHVPNGKYYDNTVIDTDSGEQWFCSPLDARDAGWRRSGM
jgi:phosphatidylserine/phosphatidylglycerophosphate/cardiolipin synthase-like enzyme